MGRNGGNTKRRESEKRSRSGLCLKSPDLRYVGDIVLNPSLAKVNVNKVNIVYGIVLLLLAVHLDYIDKAFNCIS